MKRLLWLLVLILLFIAGCGDNDSSSNGVSSGFTSSMIDDDTYYLSYEKDGETVQSTIYFSDGTATVIDEWYDSEGNYLYRGTYQLIVTLNDDGSLTATSSSSDEEDTLSESSDYTVEWSFDSDSWIDDWHTEIPDDWYETNEFTSDMIDNDIYYVSYQDGLYTVQETITFSGDAVLVSKNYYDDNGVWSSSEEDTSYVITLNDDGTLSGITNNGIVTFILVSETEEFLLVYAADDKYSYTGTDNWYFSDPTE
ncbi:hypothetical protein SAMN05660420_01741 [Desulfuromusa kysingii]|uniref:YD repeat-containing protein n=1 Tax=Desulfuromusa kysingii TaxID=37625 RepID=A0A1H3ZZQ5_9BACT|nr:hypothetical protein [Desulfuromusa kysingii]SEA29140.1 hypothetical protein SAMN05660420_01741 [Desulfuromusa kysingii]